MAHPGHRAHRRQLEIEMRVRGDWVLAVAAINLEALSALLQAAPHSRP